MAEQAQSPIQKLVMSGQSVWLDSLKRSMTRNGELKRLIDEEGLRGMTSNPSIFEKAIGAGTEYDAQIEALLNERDWDVKELYEALAIQDIQDAADLFRPVFDRTQGLDGYVSLEVSPYLARDARATVEEARRLWRALARQNVMIKVPATKECVPAIEDLIAEGININITLLFAQERYEEVANAYLSGLERLLASEKTGTRARRLDQIASVASFFVSRIDTLADTLIEDQIRIAPTEAEKTELRSLQGKVAIANAKLAYERFLRIYRSDRWHRLAAKGARPQRLLWASTSVKNKAYPDVMYLNELIGPETVTTVPPATFAAFRDHGKVEETLTKDVPRARQVLESLEKHRISLHEITEMLTSQAIELFSDPFDKLLGALEKKRRSLLGKRMNAFAYELPAELNLLVSEHLKQWSAQGKVRRFWNKDASLWTSDGESQWMGWLSAIENSLSLVPEIRAFSQEIRDEGFEDVVVLGMGGSSLAPSVFSSVFKNSQPFPRLSVLDSTHPEQIRRLQSKISPKKTLFIVSSKSGGTLEPNLLYQHFRAILGKSSGSNFVAITDPGSSLETLAKKESFRRIFLGDPEIGGRYSALSVFGLVPAALMGVDVDSLLRRARRMALSCGRFSPPKENPGVHLGVVLGVLAQHGRNKVSFVSSLEVCALEVWLEQLLAESTGKGGKGVIPISYEPLSSVEAYGSDRVFVYLKYEKAGNPAHERQIEEKLIRLQESGQPVLRILIRELENLGQEFFRWEVATAVLGESLGINPFDQPDVEEAKKASRILMDQFEKTGELPKNDALVFKENSKEIQASLEGLFGRLRLGDCFTILAYLPESEAVREELSEIRILVRNHMRVASALQFGPRYLHSTGQAFKGGADQEVFLVLTDRTDKDVKIAGERFGFDAVVRSQALGDLRVLRERGKRVVHLDLGESAEQALKGLHHLVRHALRKVEPLNNQINTEGLNREFSRKSAP